MRSEERLLVLASLARPTAEEREEAIRLARGRPSWEEIWRLAEDNATAPLVQWNLERLGVFDEVVSGVASRFRARSERIGLANDARLAVAKRLFARFAEARIRVVILKGVFFAERIYGNPRYKKMNDVDILVRHEDLDAVLGIYDEMGFFSAAAIDGEDARERTPERREKERKRSHHAPPFFSRDLACMLGTHWGLITPLSPYKLDYEGIWSRVREFDFYGNAAFSLAPEDNLHHLAVHLPYYKTGVRELADIYNLLRHERDALDLERFSHDVARAKTENLVYHALALSNRLCPVDGVADLLERLRPRVSRYYRRDVERKTRDVSRLLSSRSVHMSRIEKRFADLQATAEPREMWTAFLQMWRNILWPAAEDVARMNSLVDPGFLERVRARIASPIRISRVFVRDLGAPIYALLIVKTALDVLRQTFVPEKSERRKDLAAFAASIGVSAESLERLKDSLE